MRGKINIIDPDGDIQVEFDQGYKFKRHMHADHESRLWFVKSKGILPGSKNDFAKGFQTLH